MRRQHLSYLVFALSLMNGCDRRDPGEVPSIVPGALA